MLRSLISIGFFQKPNLAQSGLSWSARSQVTTAPNFRQKNSLCLQRVSVQNGYLPDPTKAGPQQVRLFFGNEGRSASSISMANPTLWVLEGKGVVHAFKQGRTRVLDSSITTIFLFSGDPRIFSILCYSPCKNIHPHRVSFIPFGLFWSHATFKTSVR